ncbi:hypothetical protein [Salinibaculum rarum]|uniref:hypothetical protein n=1 Tax=Salinibaculum rarum TaxID=3058903 RepID=UPI00265F3D25|nr:hypothetical protein [Salinibaculum sp. KK48]
MSRYRTLIAVFVSVVLVIVAGAAVTGLIMADERADGSVNTSQWQFDTVATDGAEDGGETVMDSNASTNTVVVHVGTAAQSGGTLLNGVPLQRTGQAITTGSPAGTERAVGPLVSTLVENGHEVTFYEQSTTGGSFSNSGGLSETLTDADAFVTTAPTVLSDEDRKTVATFASEGGRVFVGADPGQARGVVDIGSQRGIYQEIGYLYDVANNDQNFLSVFVEPTGSTPLTEGIDRVVFRGAAPIAQSGEEPALTTAGDAQLTTTQRTAQFGVAAVDGNMAVVGDTSFVAPENAYRADNNVLIGNIADFLVSGSVSENPFQQSGDTGISPPETPTAGPQPPTGGGT